MSCLYKAASINHATLSSVAARLPPFSSVSSDENHTTSIALKSYCNIGSNGYLLKIPTFALLGPGFVVLEKDLERVHIGSIKILIFVLFLVGFCRSLRRNCRLNALEI